MALEIERRFLVQGSGWRARVGWQARLRQGYLRSDADGFTLRVRLSSAEPFAAAFATGHGEWREGEQREFVPRLETTLPTQQAWLTLKAALPTVLDPSHQAEAQAVGEPAACASASLAATAASSRPRPRSRGWNLNTPSQPPMANSCWHWPAVAWSNAAMASISPMVTGWWMCLRRRMPLWWWPRWSCPTPTRPSIAPSGAVLNSRAGISSAMPHWLNVP